MFFFNESNYQNVASYIDNNIKTSDNISPSLANVSLSHQHKSQYSTRFTKSNLWQSRCNCRKISKQVLSQILNNYRPHSLWFLVQTRIHHSKRQTFHIVYDDVLYCLASRYVTVVSCWKERRANTLAQTE